MVEVASAAAQVESYLCQKNAGHLIRIAGPAFEQVCSWAGRVPLKVAFKGIDQYCGATTRKGLRRRPVRIEFCEADILELFDDWRRAVGVSASSGVRAESAPKAGLSSHIERVMARLAMHSASSAAVMDPLVTQFMHELDRLLAESKHARGDKRAAIVEPVGEIDSQLLDAGVAALDPSTRASLLRDAENMGELFAARMSPDTYRAALDAAFRRLVRETGASGHFVQ